jgi:hypothetical protein
MAAVSVNTGRGREVEATSGSGLQPGEWPKATDVDTRPLTYGLASRRSIRRTERLGSRYPARCFASLRLRARRPAIPPRARSTPTASKVGVSLPAPVEANEDDVPEVPEVPGPVFPAPPEEVDAELTGAIVVVVAGFVDVVDPVDVVDVVVELEVVVEDEGVVVVVGSALGVAVQQVLKVCALPGANALTPGPSVEVAYSQTA